MTLDSEILSRGMVFTGAVRVLQTRHGVEFHSLAASCVCGLITFVMAVGVVAWRGNWNEEFYVFETIAALLLMFPMCAALTRVVFDGTTLFEDYCIPGVVRLCSRAWTGANIRVEFRRAPALVENKSRLSDEIEFLFVNGATNRPFYGFPLDSHETAVKLASEIRRRLPNEVRDETLAVAPGGTGVPTTTILGHSRETWPPAMIDDCTVEIANLYSNNRATGDFRAIVAVMLMFIVGPLWIVDYGKMIIFSAFGGAAVLMVLGGILARLTSDSRTLTRDGRKHARFIVADRFVGNRSKIQAEIDADQIIGVQICRSFKGDREHRDFEGYDEINLVWRVGEEVRRTRLGCHRSPGAAAKSAETLAEFVGVPVLDHTEPASMKVLSS